MNKLAIFIFAGICILFSSSQSYSQNLDSFCKDLKATLDDIKRSHPEWPFYEPKDIYTCFISIEDGVWTDATRLLQVSARVAKTTEAAIDLDNEYRTRMQRVVSDRRKCNKKLRRQFLNENALPIELASSSNGWQSLQRWDFAPNESVLFGRYNRLFIRITFEKFPYIDRIQDFILNYKFDQ